MNEAPNEGLRTNALWPIVLVVMIGYIGTAMPYPIFAPLFLGARSRIAQSSLLSPIILYSLLMAIYPFGTLIGSAYLGQFSDRVGRKSVIFSTALIAVGTNLISGYAIVIANYALIFAARFLTGVCEGNISVARAALTDLDLKQTNKSIAFGYLSTASYAAYLVGPLLGGFFSYYVNFSAPFFLAAALCALAAIACWAYMPETRPTASVFPSRDAVSFWRQRGLKILLGIQFLITLTINVYHEFFPALMVEKLHANPYQISYATIIATTTMITLSMFGMRAILQKWSTAQLYFCSMLMLGVSVALFTLPGQLVAIYPIFVAFGISLAIFNSSSNGWLSDTYAATSQGKLMGVIGSMFFLSNIVAATLGGMIASYSIDALMLLGGAIAIISCLAFKIAIRPPKLAGGSWPPGGTTR
jgi:DHA1 family tetracycline resistance protein-like MFS transporter